MELELILLIMACAGFSNLLHQAIFVIFHYRFAMKNFQHHEYQKHKKSLYGMLFIVIPAVAAFTFTLYFFSVNKGCAFMAVQYYVAPSDKSICTIFDNTFFSYKGGIMLVFQICMIIPCIFYYAFRSLRMSCDCFECFNRIPHLRYSIYQYTAYERNIQKEERYFGMGAVNAYNNLIDNELRRTMFPSSEVSRKSTLVKASRG